LSARKFFEVLKKMIQNSFQKEKNLKFTGFGIWSPAGFNVENTSEHFFNSQDLNSELLDTTETQFLKLKRSHPSLSRLDIPESFFSPNLLALVALDEAVTQAGLNKSDLQKMRVGVCLGSTVGGTSYDEEFAAKFYSGKFPDPEILNHYFKTNTAQFISRYLGLKGPRLLISNACASSLDSIGVGQSWLNSNLCDLVICGGTEALLPRMGYGFKSLMLTAPDGICRPFDLNRRGFVLSEGAGILILEKDESPRKAKAHLNGYGTASDALNSTAPDPEARGLSRAVNEALKQSRLRLDEVDFVSTHGVGSEQSDLAEGKWLKKNLPKTPLVALKGSTGHTLGAAGAISTILTILSLQKQKLPASKGFEEMDPEIGLCLNKGIQNGNFETALILGLAFGGINSALCLSKASNEGD
jgi:3-oxoacyl-(acyl-carrier-protein) synthase